MSTVLVYTSPARGHLYPIMGVALALRDAGHEVVVQTLRAEETAVRHAALTHRPLSREVEALEMRDYVASTPLTQLRAVLECWAARAPHEVADLQASLDEVQPDLVVVDANSWGASALAEAQHRPWAAFLPYALPFPSPDAPAFGPGFRPPRTALGRLRDRGVWAVQTLLARQSLARLNELRAELGVPALARLSDLFERADVLLYLTAEPFEYPRRQWPRGLHLVGPGLWAPEAYAPAWVADLPRPRVLVSVSTELQQDDAIVEAALVGLADEPGSIVVTTGALPPEQFRAPHERVRIERFLPHAAVVPHMDVVVTHGGMGTVHRSLAAGVPVCVVPWGRDQKESARRAQLRSAGVIVPRGRLSPDRLRAGVREALQCRPGAEAVAAAFANAPGPAGAARLLEELLSGEPGVLTPDAAPDRGRSTG